MYKSWGLAFPMLLWLSACTTVPTAPHVLVLPGVGKPFDQFQVDEIFCRQHAQQQIVSTPTEAKTQNTVHGAFIGTIIGAGVGAAIGAATGSPEAGAAIGAGAGVLIGTAAGAEAGSAAAGTLQWRYDLAYVQCMYAKGNQVPGGATPSSYVPPPPDALPPAGMAPPPPPPEAPPS
jgi:hypothetical protein